LNVEARRTLLIAVWLILVLGMSVLLLFYARQLQAWHARILRRFKFPRFILSVAESKYALWQTRFLGLVALAMFLLVGYLMLFR